MNLYDEDHVDLILKLMPNLMYLNSLAVERDDDNDFNKHRKSTETRPSDIDEDEENYSFSPPSIIS